jgi:hypothetical protein
MSLRASDYLELSIPGVLPSPIKLVLYFNPIGGIIGVLKIPTNLHRKNTIFMTSVDNAAQKALGKGMKFMKEGGDPPQKRSERGRKAQLARSKIWGSGRFLAPWSDQKRDDAQRALLDFAIGCKPLTANTTLGGSRFSWLDDNSGGNPRASDDNYDVKDQAFIARKISMQHG